MKGSVREDKSRGTWSLVIDNGIDPATGKRRQVRRRGFKTRKAADLALGKLMREAQEGAYDEPSSQPLRTYLVNWLKGVAANKKPATAGMYTHKLHRYVIPQLGAVPLRQIDAAMLNALYRELETSGGRPDAEGNPTALSKQTVAVVHRILRKALQDAAAENLIRSNPATVAKAPKSTAARRMRTWDAEQLRTFLEHVADDRLSALWVVATTTGMRRGEVCGLQWDDIGLDAAELAVMRSRVPVSGTIHESTPKTGRTRVVALDEATVSALRRHRSAQLEERLAWGEAWTDTGYVFTREDGTPLRPDTVTKTFATLAHGAGLPPIALHCLRHSHATLGLRAGIPAKVMSERLGHSKVGTTLDLYSHVVPGMQEDAAAKLGALVFGT